MSFDEIKSDQDSGAHNRPNFIVYQPAHMSGLAFLVKQRKVNLRYFTGSSTAGTREGTKLILGPRR